MVEPLPDRMLTSRRELFLELERCEPSPPRWLLRERDDELPLELPDEPELDEPLLPRRLDREVELPVPMLLP